MKFDYPSHAIVPVSKVIEPEEEEKSSMASSHSNFSSAKLPVTDERRQSLSLEHSEDEDSVR